MRYQPGGSYLRSFVSAESLFIDIMMNVGIVFYAAKESDHDSLWHVARQHCLTTRRCLVRGDGSTAHEGIFDTASGEFLRQSTHQGWRGDSCWARGQAWALYGFTSAFRFTDDPRFLRTAQSCADYFIERAGSNGVPPNDLDEPSPRLPYESSAAAIAASGMLELAALTDDKERSARYGRHARQTISTLCGPGFLARGEAGWEGILLHGIYHQGRGLGVDESVMWGDYYLLEAISKVLENGR
jgi:unsaturated chondroitin disaccharide hydrolase